MVGIEETYAWQKGASSVSEWGQGSRTEPGCDRVHNWDMSHLTASRAPPRLAPSRTA